LDIKDAFIHTFNTRQGYYLYDVNTNSILKIDKNLYEYINKRKNGSSEIKEDLEEKINKMRDQGFLSSKRVEKMEHSFSSLLPYVIKNRLSSITLQVTQQCNLRCEYCVYSGSYKNRIHDDKSMSFDIAKKGIDLLIENSSESNMINIGFYGGEPLLRPDFIMQCVEYAKEQAEGQNILFHMTTNGTLLKGKIADYMAENDVQILVSLDGPEEIHDKNRKFASNGKGTFKVIMENIAELKKKHPEYVKKNISFNAVLDGTTDFHCTTKFFCEYEDIKDFRINTASVSNQYSNKEIRMKESFYIDISYERFKFLLYKLGKLDKRYASKLYETEFAKSIVSINERKNYKSVSKKEHHGGPCVPGLNRLFMDTDGTFYPCERVSELSEHMKIGNIYDGFDLDKMDKILNIGRLTEDKCRNCWAYRFCYLCAAFADNIEGLSKEKKLSNCVRVRNDIEERMKNYCMMREMGYAFNDEAAYALEGEVL